MMRREGSAHGMPLRVGRFARCVDDSLTILQAA